DGFVVVGALTYATGLNPINHQTQVLGVDDNVVPGWATVSETFDVEEGQNEVVPYIRGTEVTVGKWAFDEIVVAHLEGNFANLESDTFTVQPGRTYKLMASVTSDAAVEAGKLKAVVTYTATGRDPVVEDSSDLSPTAGIEKLFSHDFTVPSGYTTAQVEWVAQDVPNGAFRIRESSVSFRDTDVQSMWVDTVSAATAASYTQLVNNTTAPDGAERYRAELVAEQGDAGWVVDDVDVHRREATADAEDIVDDLFRDPDTDAYLIPPGTIHAAGLIEYDWHIRNLTCREALRILSTSGLAGTREWKVNADGTVDWGTDEELFTDRTSLVLVDDDLILREVPDVETDSVNRVTRVKVIGADRTPVGGQKRLITGQAEADPGDAVDWYGNALSRTRLVQDSTIDTPDHAEARAEIELDDIGRQSQPVTAQLADVAVAGRFDVGDWMYLHSARARLYDVTNPVDRGGRTVFPARKRVLSRTRKLGPGHRVELRRFNGDPEDISRFIDWEPETSATVELGDIPAAFAPDQQGGDITVQFRRFRGSTSR
ncbi:MAG: hypothetical protein Q8K63_03580, partial [Acidimicrobiales bacterium]|nr:hypothetical protein [Acidimicrobiales bacterium]